MLIQDAINEILSMDNGLPADTYLKFTSEDNKIPFDLLFSEVRSLIDSGKMVKISEDAEQFFAFYPLYLCDTNLETNVAIIRYVNEPDDDEKSLSIVIGVVEVLSAAATFVLGKKQPVLEATSLNTWELVPFLLSHEGILGTEKEEFISRVPNLTQYENNDEDE